MPGLKKLISNIKSRGGQQDRESDFGLPKHERSDGKLQKSTHQVQDDVDILDKDIPNVKLSREFSFESGQSVADFEAELSVSASRPRNSYTANLQPRSAQRNALVSKHGLTINTAAANAQSIYRLAQSHAHVLPSDETRRSGIDVTLDDFAPSPRSKPATISSEQRYSASSSSGPSASQYSSTDNIHSVRNSQAEPTTPDTPQSSFGDLPEPGSSKAQGKQRLVAISDIDWSQIDEDEGAQIARAYGSSNVSRQNPIDNSAADHNRLRIAGQSGMENRWLNRQDFSSEYEDFLAVEENERKIQELNDLLKSLIAEDAAKEAERERLAAEEAARLLAEEEAAAEAARIAEELARLRECAVCGDAKEPLEYAAKAPTAGCQHPPQTCKECMESWMASEFETKGCDGIKCPECTETLEYNDVQECASAETFDKYDKLATRNALGSLDEFAWCLKPECGSGQMNIDNNCFMDCVSCGYKQCLKHKVPWHKGETCDQYEYRVSGQQQRDEEKKTEEMLDLVSKRCPNKTCGWRIQKISGCEHMTCKKCKHEFCWLCLAAHADIKKEGNTAHAKNCKFHSANLEVSWPFNAH